MVAAERNLGQSAKPSREPVESPYAGLNRAGSRAPTKTSLLKPNLKPNKSRKTSVKVAKIPAKAELPVLSFATSARFTAWIKAQPARSPGLWLRLGKKGSALKTLSYQEALDVALAWGWIDGQLKTHDQDSWLRKFTPRGVRSVWSKINRDKALALIASGQMRAAGLAEVERAKKDGRWQAAYDSASKAQVPPDFSAALAKSKRASGFFETLESHNRYALLFRIHWCQEARDARPQDTRVRGHAGARREDSPLKPDGVLPGPAFLGVGY